MNRRVYCIYLLLLSALSVQAGDSTHVRYTLPYIGFFETTYSHPSAALWRPVRDRVTVEAAWQQHNAPNYHLIREGRSGNSFKLSAEGIQRDVRSAFWGSASYRNHTRNGTKWTNVTDLHRIGPYQVTDSIGGNVLGEEYLLSGGFSLTAGKYTWSAEAGYRAGNDYRKRDPRPQTTISAPYLRIGAAMPTGDYRLGATLSAGLYQQRLSVTTVESHRSDTYFAMKGFGMYDRQQSDYGSTFSWLYEGNNYGLSLFMLPKTGSGWLGSVAWLSENTESYSKANMYPFLFRINSVNFQAGPSQKSRYGTRAIKIEGYLQQGKGKERIYENVPIEGNSDGILYEYRLLSESGRYVRDKVSTKASFLQEWYRTKNDLWVEAGTGFISYAERYISPDYQITHIHLDISARTGIEFISDKSSLITELKVGYRPLLNSQKNVSDNDDLFNASMAPDLEVMLSSPLSAECMVRYEYLKDKVKWFVSGNLSFWGIKDRNAIAVQLTAGIKL
ncbi:DUF6850 family outer membrane beta-barrel protein [Proteiniphilum sp.]|uniref:DUF6850 family outer membrane beta-barrel protein n=1 Tax=Proteiniphilum sp. TaxID=1926877 RepID=UPI002B1EFE4E|nr:DUF6850 family outer membrane beta-barrel protein [Proteiniphilum sp.]MEA4916141.1 hypothetical protein [Proteiniphilum sp.]